MKERRQRHVANPAHPGVTVVTPPGTVRDAFVHFPTGPRSEVSRSRGVAVAQPGPCVIQGCGPPGHCLTICFSAFHIPYTLQLAATPAQRRCGPAAHFVDATLAQMSLFCKREEAYGGGGRCPTEPTLQRFWVQGDSPCTPGGGCAPCTLLGGTERERILTLLHYKGERFLGCQRARGRDGGEQGRCAGSAEGCARGLGSRGKGRTLRML